MQLYNTLTRSLEPFVPAGPDITLYVCGITPYDTTHLGHAFTYATADVLVRYLESRGHRVRYAQNVTDIDDDILRKAAEAGEDWRALGNRWTAHFIRDMQALNVRPPDYYPRATDVIPEIIAAVSTLVERGLGYAAGGSVYYSVARWPAFGRLSGLAPAEQLPIANERGNRPDDPHKQHPLDFVLWQAQASGEPAWDSPWGPGRPGWHIECTTLSTRFLGATLDLHSGGGDLVFPHHECEIAQAEPLTGQQPFVRTWLHTAMVEHAGAKMSKSLGNLIMVRDLLQDWTPDALRLYLGRHHYRQVWAHNPDELAAAGRLAQRLRAAVEAGSGAGPAIDPAPAESAFQAAMDRDLDTAAALDSLERLAADIEAGALAGRALQAAQACLRRLSLVFGLRLDAPEPEAHVIAGWNAHLERFG